MEEIAKVNAVLDELGFPYSHEHVEENVEGYTITLDAGEDLELDGLLYETEDGAFFRLLAYVDEVSEERRLEQLTLLLALNGEMPTGAYCLDPEEMVVYTTVNVPVGELNSDLISWVFEFLFVSQEVYLREFYGDDAPEEAQG
ncbi:YbjN domain-containing protein [bacterium]|nr:YbjN domain-containing protein [bacterium]